MQRLDKSLVFAFLAISLFSLVYIPAQGWFILLLFGQAILLKRISQHSPFSSLFLFRTNILLASFVAAHSWRGWYLDGVFWLGPLILLVFLVTALQLTGLRPPPKSPSPFSRFLWLGLLVLAVFTSIAAWVATLWFPPNISSQSLVLDGSLYNDQLWLMPGTAVAAGAELPFLYALIAWTLFLGAAVALAAEEKLHGICQSHLLKAAKVWLLVVIILTAVQVIGWLDPLMHAFEIDAETRLCVQQQKISDEKTPASVQAKLKQRLEDLVTARRMGLPFVESSALVQAMHAAAQAGESPLAAVFAAQYQHVHNKDQQAELELGGRLLLAGQVRPALNQFNEENYPDSKLLAASPCNAVQALWISEIWRSRNRIDIVMDTLKPFVHLPQKGETMILRPAENIPAEQQVLRRYGDYCIYSGHYDEARRIAKSILAVNPEDPLALNQMAEILIEQGKFTEAFPYASAAWRQDRSNYRLAGNLAIVNAELGYDIPLRRLRKRMTLKFLPTAWEGKQKWRLYQNGEAYLQGEFVPGPVRLEFGASATAIKGKYPRMQLWINGEKIDEQDAVSDQFVRYAFEFTLRRGPNRIAIHFENDQAETQGNRNLFLGAGRFLSRIQAKPTPTEETAP